MENNGRRARGQHHASKFPVLADFAKLDANARQQWTKSRPFPYQFLYNRHRNMFCLKQQARDHQAEELDIDSSTPSAQTRPQRIEQMAVDLNMADLVAHVRYIGGCEMGLDLMGPSCRTSAGNLVAMFFQKQQDTNKTGKINGTARQPPHQSAPHRSDLRDRRNVARISHGVNTTVESPPNLLMPTLVLEKTWQERFQLLRQLIASHECA